MVWGVLTGCCIVTTDVELTIVNDSFGQAFLGATARLVVLLTAESPYLARALSRAEIRRQAIMSVEV